MYVLSDMLHMHMHMHMHMYLGYLFIVLFVIGTRVYAQMCRALETTAALLMAIIRTRKVQIRNVTRRGLMSE